MAEVSEFPINPGTLDPETLALVGAAYDMVIGGLPGRLSREDREEVASRLVAAAMAGHRDFKTLCQLALPGTDAAA
jgi:hypothetical protein